MTDEMNLCQFLEKHHEAVTLEAVQWFRPNAPDQLTKDHNGKWPIHVACANKAPLEVVRYLAASHPEGVRTKTVHFPKGFPYTWQVHAMADVQRLFAFFWKSFQNLLLFRIKRETSRFTWHAPLRSSSCSLRSMLTASASGTNPARSLCIVPWVMTCLSYGSHCTIRSFPTEYAQ